MPQTPAIVFDVGNVLLDWQPERLYRDAFPDTEERARFMDEVVPLSWHTVQDAGRSLADGIAERISMFPQHEALIRRFYDKWLDSVESEIAGNVRIMEEVIEAGHPVHAISNFSAELWPVTVDAHPFLRRFDVAVISGEEGVTKPDPEIFRRFLARAGAEAPDCIFIDDKPENVAAAAALGFDGIVFTKPEDLRMELVKRGVRLSIELAS